MSCPSRGTWIEIHELRYLAQRYASCPSRGTWIEIAIILCQSNLQVVVPLAGHVD